MDKKELVEDLRSQLRVAKSDLEAAENEIDEDREVIASFEIKIKGLQAELSETSAKLAKLEENSQHGIENSLGANAELKQQLEDYKSVKDDKRNLANQVKELSEEVSELRAQNQELTFQQERSSTRSKIKSINEEKIFKEEIQRLQKQVRKAELAMKFRASSFEAQLRACQDKNERLQEKLKLSNFRFEELGKDKLELKLENSRLQSKLEKTGSYVEMKRMQTVQETSQLELETLRRKNTKLEEQLTIGEGGSSLSVQVQQNEITKVRKEKNILEEKNESLEQTSEVLSLKVKQLDGQLKAERTRVTEMEEELNRMKKIADSGSEDYIASLHKQIQSLEATSSDFETNFKVKEKDLWLTIEAQKKKIEELEMAKLSLELGDDDDDDYDGADATKSELNQELDEEIKALKLENKKLTEELEVANSERNDQVSLQERIKEWETANISLQTALEESNFEKQKLVNDFTSCQVELRDLSRREEKLTKKLEEAIAISKQAPSAEELQMLKQQLSELESSAAHRKGPNPDQIADLEREVEKLSQLNSRLMEDLEAAEEEANLMEERVMESVKLRTEIEKLKQQNKKYQDDLESAEEELEKVDAELVEQTRVLKEEIEYLKKTNEKQAILSSQGAISLPGQKITAINTKETLISSASPAPQKRTTVVVAKKANPQSTKSGSPSITQRKEMASMAPVKATKPPSSFPPSEKPKKQVPPPPAAKKPILRRKV